MTKGSTTHERKKVPNHEDALEYDTVRYELDEGDEVRVNDDDRTLKVTHASQWGQTLVSKLGEKFQMESHRGDKCEIKPLGQQADGVLVRDIEFTRDDKEVRR